MAIFFKRRKIETACIILSFVLIIIMTIMGIFALADKIFYWDIFPKDIENVLLLLMSSTGLVIAATFLLSIMVNFSLISLSLEKIAESFDRYLIKDNRNDSKE